MKLPELTYRSPNTFTRKQRIQLALLPPAIVGLLRAILFTCPRQTRGQHYLDETLAQHGHAILAIWHEATAYALYLHSGSNFHAASSFSFDGELAARLTHQFNVECVRGSSSKGGAEVLRELEKAIPLVGCVGLTMDGPRGPRRHAQPGLAILSARTGVPVVPLAFAISKSWRLRTWDRMAVPKPFAKLLYGYAPPIAPAPNTEREAIDAKRLEIERSLNHLHEELEAELGDTQTEVLTPTP